MFIFVTPLFVITTSKAPIKGLGGAAHPMLYAPIRTVGHHQNRLGLAAAAGLGSGIVVLAAGTVTDLVAAADIAAVALAGSAADLARFA